ncbi:MAG: putative alkanesulfonate transport protein superfamily, inner rane component [Tardiphaga sp.]|nr:putative alkanesulfonate transport protein superfamily, inner rane component [Tardiphaga sp.]
MQSKGIYLPRGLLLPVAILLAWEVAAHAGRSGGVLIAPLEQIASTAFTLAAGGTMAVDVAATIARVMSGFVLGAVAGLLFGSVIGTSRAADWLASPTFNAVRQVPLTGWIPVAALLFGIGEGAKLSLIALAAFCPVALNTAEGLAGVSQSYRELGRSLNFSGVTSWWRILLPAATPQIFTGLKHGIAFAWIAAIAAELLLTSGPGLGSMIEGGTALFRLDIVMVGVCLIGAFGYAMAVAMERVEARFLRWRN